MLLHNGTAFTNSFARAAGYFLGTMAAAPEDPAEFAAYRLIAGVYRAVLEDAAAVGFRPLPDVSFAPWEPQKGREADVKTIRDAIAKVETLPQGLFRLADAGAPCPEGLRLPEGFPKPKKQLVNALAQAGGVWDEAARTLRLPAGCAEGLRALAGVSKAHVIPITDGPQEDKAYLFFSRCVFRPEENWVAQAFDRYLDADGRLLALCEALEQRGYTRIVCREGKKPGLDYVRQHGKKTEPVKCAWGERTHTGIELSFEELRAAPAFLWLRAPMYKTVLEHMDELPASDRAFLLAHTKTCDGCRYCVQTDKTGARPLAAISVGGKKRCPHFPGFTMNWRTLTPEVAAGILSVLGALDALPAIR